MDTVHIRILHIRILNIRGHIMYFRVEENFAGGKFRENHAQWIFISREENFAQNPNSRI